MEKYNLLYQVKGRFNFWVYESLNPTSYFKEYQRKNPMDWKSEIFIADV